MIENVKHKGLALAILAAAQFMVILDATIVNVALPAIQKSLGFSGSQLQWIITAYALTFGGFLLLGGRLADLFGRRRLFVVGVVIFAGASLLGGSAQNPTMLITFRALQGLGGALLAPAALSLVLTIFKEGQERNRALGIWSMVSGGGGAVGLLLGGLLTQYVHWSWIFFINVPIAVIVVVLAMKYLPKSLPVKSERVDIIGGLAITTSLAALVYGLAEVPTQTWSGTIPLVSFGLGALLMAGFVINERLVKVPLIALGIFRKRNVTAATIIQILLPAALFGMFFYLSIYEQQILGYTPTETGLANLPFTGVLIIIAAVLSRRIAHINPKPLLVIAPLVMASGLFYFSRLPLHANYVKDILPGVAMMAIGMAITFVTATVIATNGISAKQSGLVSGLLNTSQQIGGAIGLAVLSVISTAATKTAMLNAHGNLSALPQSIVTGFQHGFFAAALFAICGSIVALIVVKTRKPNISEDKAQLQEVESISAIPGV
jgi:EmrB/QacA subfamily drug resistance transporter